MKPKAQVIRVKMDKGDNSKLNNFCVAKERIKEIFGMEHLQIMHLIRGYIQNTEGTLRTNNKTNPKLPNFKMANDLNRHFSTEDIQMDKKHEKRYLISLSLRAMQIKNKRRHCFTYNPVRVTISKTSK